MNATVNKVFRVKNMRDGMPAQKRLISTYHGSAFTAEREGDELNIYHISKCRAPPCARRSRVGPRP